MFVSTGINLQIAPNRLISDIQKEFNSVFPFLKLEFFYNKNLSHSKLSIREITPRISQQADSQKSNSDGFIKINGEMRVNELEDIFQKNFGLSVQVFRKSGNLWLETTMTDNWTLQHQNNHGREISAEAKKSNDTNDYDLSRDSNN